MKKSVFRELHVYDEPIKKPEPAYAVKEENEKEIEEKKEKKKNGRKFSI